jgi:hypothetical protein
MREKMQVTREVQRPVTVVTIRRGDVQKSYRFRGHDDVVGCARVAATTFKREHRVPNRLKVEVVRPVQLAYVTEVQTFEVATEAAMWHAAPETDEEVRDRAAYARAACLASMEDAAATEYIRTHRRAPQRNPRLVERTRMRVMIEETEADNWIRFFETA